MLSITLFGKFQAQTENRLLSGFDIRKVQELFCYLLLYRERPHLRETLATLLWSDNPAAQSKKLLRQTLWQLQTALQDITSEPVLLIDSEWISLNERADVRLDVALFEAAFAQVQGISGYDLDDAQMRKLEVAVNFFTADLLEGWYQDWCLYERERLRRLLVITLNKLVEYCEKHHQYEEGLFYGNRILRADGAHERTHRQLMKLYYLAGDRTAALRQYRLCVDTLHEELGVAPTRQTQSLYEQIRIDRLSADEPTDLIPLQTPTINIEDMLQHLQSLLTELQLQMERHEIAVLREG